MLRSHAFTQPALACVGSRDSAPSAMPPQRIALQGCGRGYQRVVRAGAATAPELLLPPPPSSAAVSPAATAAAAGARTQALGWLGGAAIGWVGARRGGRGRLACRMPPRGLPAPRAGTTVSTPAGTTMVLVWAAAGAPARTSRPRSKAIRIEYNYTINFAAATANACQPRRPSIPRATISRMISLVPSRIRWTRRSRTIFSIP